MPDYSQYAVQGASEQSCVPTEASARWFVVYTVPRHEKLALRSLIQHEIETFLPLYRVQRDWKKRGKVFLELPLFPNYLFVRIVHHMRSRVLRVASVLSIVSTGGEPAAVSDHEIEAIRAGLSLQIIHPHAQLRVGEKARIKTGPLAGMEGFVVRVKNKLRVVLTVATIMQSFAVEVDVEDVEPSGIAGRAIAAAELEQ